MLTALTEAALRCLILAPMIWAGLRIFRIQSAIAQRCAWNAVLVGSLLMPFALPFTARWHILPRATISAPGFRDLLQPALASSRSIAVPLAVRSSEASIAPRVHDRQGASGSEIATTSQKLVYGPFSSSLQPLEQSPVSLQAFPAGTDFSPVRLALLIYVVIASMLLFRLLLGLAAALRLWHTSIPVMPGEMESIGPDLNLRFSRRVSTPVTIGTGIILPANFRSWTDEKLRIVLAHERSHVTLHDFHVQILASLYAALTWFSPLGWWLKHKLSDLGEAISDGCGLNAASSRTAYAEVLLEFAATPRPTLIGVAMARPTSISRRIERLLDDSYLRRAFAGGARAPFAVLVVPAVLFAAAALVQVQAATQPKPLSSAPNASIATSTLLTAPRVSIASAASRPLATYEISGADSSLAPSETALALPPAPPSPPAAVENSASQSEATFDRSLSFNGKLDLSVGTASGNITFTRGPANQIKIHGIVKANENGDPAQVQQIAANPPIEQEGNTIRIGAHGENLRNISISYEIEAPADTTLNAATASGNIANTGVGDGAKMTSASGNITATGLQGGFIVQTGSGNITVEGTGQGDAKAQTGSGTIELRGVNGALKAQTGSGTIKAIGKPSSAWKLQAGSGNIELATGGAAMDLDASTGSGSISSTASGAMQSSNDRHHIHTQLNGGGPEVRVETGSGNIHVE